MTPLLVSALACLLWASPALAAPAPPPAVPVIEATLSRSEFDAAIARGPQRIVAAVEVTPALDHGRFVGFQIVRFRPDADLAGCQSLQPGDVLISVNRESLERPEQFMRAWDVVKAASALEVEILRAGQRQIYRWRIAP